MPTLKDIAKLSGVSVATVSKVMSRSSERDRISPGTIRRISKIARHLGYQPNGNAQALVRRKSSTLGVYVGAHPGGRINEAYVSPILEGICDAAREIRHDVLLIDFGDTQAELEHVQEKLLTKRVDGVILINVQRSQDVMRRLIGLGKPLVAVDNHSLPIPSVNLDNASGIDQIVEYLAGLGHRAIAFLGELSSEPMNDHQLRKEAFVSSVRRRNLQADCTVVDTPTTGNEIAREGSFCQEDGYQGLDWLLSTGKRFSAVVCYNDLVAMGAMRRLAEANLSIPKDVSITGFDDVFFSGYLFPPLTTVSHPTRQMGKQAVQLMLESLDDAGDASAVRKSVLLQPELIVRGSTAPYEP